MSVIQSTQSNVYVVDCTPENSYLNIALYFEGMMIDFSLFGWLITYYSTTISSNKQAIPSLGNRTYIYGFGMLPISIQLGGIMLPNIKWSEPVKEKGKDKYDIVEVVFSNLDLADFLSGLMVHETTTPFTIYLANKTVNDIKLAKFQKCFLHRIRVEYKNPTTRIGGFFLGFIAGRQTG